MNTLYYGDNLDILRTYIKDESIDLIYLDKLLVILYNYSITNNIKLYVEKKLLW